LFALYGAGRTAGKLNSSFLHDNSTATEQTIENFTDADEVNAKLRKGMGTFVSPVVERRVNREVFKVNPYLPSKNRKKAIKEIEACVPA